MGSKERKQESIAWLMSVPIFRDHTIAKQLSVACGIPFGLLTMFLLYLAQHDSDAWYGLVLVAFLLFVTAIFILIVWKGRYDVSFVVSHKGIRCMTQERQQKTNLLINTLTFTFGLLSRQPTSMGAGLLAQSRQDVFVRWQSVRKVTCDPKRLTILVDAGLASKLLVWCTSDNYASVNELISESIPVAKLADKG